MPSILITGGTGKLGKHLVRHFLALGWEVGFTSTRPAGVSGLRADLGSPGALHGFVLDLADRDSIDSLVDSVKQEMTGVDFLVNNARSLDGLKIQPDGLTDRDDFLQELLIDVVAPYELTMKLAELERLRGVVNIGSMYGVVAPNLALYEDPASQSPVQYGVAKAALIQLTRELAVRLASRQVRVNCVAYGGFEGRVDQAFLDRYAKLVPNGRMLREDEFSGPIEFLCSDASSGMTGHTLSVDGGWTAW